jgi:hypothetical protein
MSKRPRDVPPSFVYFESDTGQQHRLLSTIAKREFGLVRQMEEDGFELFDPERPLVIHIADTSDETLQFMVEMVQKKAEGPAEWELRMEVICALNYLDAPNWIIDLMWDVVRLLHQNGEGDFCNTAFHYENDLNDVERELLQLFRRHSIINTEQEFFRISFWNIQKPDASLVHPRHSLLRIPKDVLLAHFLPQCREETLPIIARSSRTMWMYIKEYFKMCAKRDPPANFHSDEDDDWIDLGRILFFNYGKRQAEHFQRNWLMPRPLVSERKPLDLFRAPYVMTLTVPEALNSILEKQTFSSWIESYNRHTRARVAERIRAEKEANAAFEAYAKTCAKEGLIPHDKDYFLRELGRGESGEKKLIMQRAKVKGYWQKHEFDALFKAVALWKFKEMVNKL